MPTPTSSLLTDAASYTRNSANPDHGPTHCPNPVLSLSTNRHLIPIREAVGVFLPRHHWRRLHQYQMSGLPLRTMEAKAPQEAGCVSVGYPVEDGLAPIQ